MDISPDKQNIDTLFSNTQYYIDFYQREYKWTTEPVERLLDDIFFYTQSPLNHHGNPMTLFISFLNVIIESVVASPWLDINRGGEYYL